MTKKSLPGQATFVNQLERNLTRPYYYTMSTHRPKLTSTGKEREGIGLTQPHLRLKPRHAAKRKWQALYYKADIGHYNAYLQNVLGHQR